MNPRNLCTGLSLALLAHGALAGGGLSVTAPESLWPQWRARIALQTATPTTLALSGLYDPAAASRAFQGGALLGDYYFARPSFGQFRASGGVLIGQQGGAPGASALIGGRLNLALNSVAWSPTSPGIDSPGAQTYVGLGYTSAWWGNSLSFSADLGMVTEHLGAAAGVGRAVFGTQGMDSALRELRLSPVLQLGVRYAF